MKNQKLKSLLLQLGELDTNSEIENLNDEMAIKVRGGLSARARNRSSCNNSSCNNSSCNTEEVLEIF